MTFRKSAPLAFAAAILCLVLFSCVGGDADKQVSERRREEIEDLNEENRLRAYHKLEKDGYGHYDPMTGLFMWRKNRVRSNTAK